MPQYRCVYCHRDFEFSSDDTNRMDVLHSHLLNMHEVHPFRNSPAGILCHFIVTIESIRATIGTVNPAAGIHAHVQCRRCHQEIDYFDEHGAIRYQALRHHLASEHDIIISDYERLNEHVLAQYEAVAVPLVDWSHVDRARREAQESYAHSAGVVKEKPKLEDDPNARITQVLADLQVKETDA
jgi:hypothetical protein